MRGNDKSPGVDNIPAEVLSMYVCWTIETIRQWPKHRTQSLIIPLPKKATHDLAELQKDRHVYHPKNKVLLRVTLKRLSKPGRTDLGRGTVRFQITEEYHRFRVQIFNLMLLLEKHLERHNS